MFVLKEFDLFMDLLDKEGYRGEELEYILQDPGLFHTVYDILVEDFLDPELRDMASLGFTNHQIDLICNDKETLTEVREMLQDPEYRLLIKKSNRANNKIQRR